MLDLLANKHGIFWDQEKLLLDDFFFHYQESLKHVIHLLNPANWVLSLSQHINTTSRGETIRESVTHQCILYLWSSPDQK